VFAPITVEHFLLCVACARMPVAAHVGAKQKQRHFSTVCVWDSSKPGSCHSCIFPSPEPAIQSCSHRVECIKIISIFS